MCIRDRAKIALADGCTAANPRPVNLQQMEQMCIRDRIETDYQVCAMEDTVLRFSASRPVMVTAGEESRVIKGEAEWKLDFPKAEPVFLRIRPVK